jgi:hypothetical protein
MNDNQRGPCASPVRGRERDDFGAAVLHEEDPVGSSIRGLTAVAVTIGLTAAVLDSSTPVLARQQSSNNRPEARAFAYSYAREAALAAKFEMDNPDPGELRRTFDERRARVLAAISRIKPGVTWTQLHELAVQMLRDAGGYDRYYRHHVAHLECCVAPVEVDVALIHRQGVPGLRPLSNAWP